MKTLSTLFNYLILVSFSFHSFSQNPLSLASEFNILTEGNLTINAGDIEGAIGVGGNLIVTGNSQRTSANKTGGISYVTIEGVKYALIVGGDLTGTNGGNIFKVDGKSGSTSDHYIRFKTLTTNTVNADGGGIDIGNPPTNPITRYVRVNATDQAANTVVNATSLFDFAAAFLDFKAKSIALTNCPANISLVNQGGQATITLGNNLTNVWNISGTVLNNFNQINLVGTLPNASNPLIINVDASGSVNWQNKKFVIAGESDDFVEINRAPYILYNFYNTTVLNIQSSNLITASILAPLADVTYNGSGNITGQVIAKSYFKPSVGELHIARFNGNIGCICPEITINAGPDSDICTQMAQLPAPATQLPTKTYQLSGQMNGTSSVLWTDNGAGGTFDDPTKLNAIYTPPINAGILTLTITSSDPSQCAPISDNVILTSVACAGILDPCVCHEVTYLPSETMEVEDFIEINGASGQNWTIIVNGGGTRPLTEGGGVYGTMQLIDNVPPMDNIPVPLGTPIPETPIGSGNYRYDFAHDSGEGYNVTVKNTQTGQELSISNFCVLNTYNPNFTVGTTICNNAAPFNLSSIIVDTDPTTSGNAVVDPVGTVAYFYTSIANPVETPLATTFNPGDYPDGTTIKIIGKYTPNPANVVDCFLTREATGNFTIVACPLSVNLISFTGRVSDESIVLNWKTTDEKDFSHYEIQKSIDAKEFASIGTVKGSEAKYYNFVDANPNMADNYYRLKIVNNDGSYEISKTISINYEKNKNFVKFENPSIDGSFTIGTNIKNPSFTILTSNGTKIGSTTISNGLNKYVVKPTNVVAGMYFLNVVSEGKVVTKKVIVRL